MKATLFVIENYTERCDPEEAPYKGSSLLDIDDVMHYI
jgi:hypothetical protein